ncbi:MAG TPA: oligosaccharide flippase family protein [Rhizomicrobium sp.]|nr:oligosaccharide flippase family protein [Rhizomicrobium sp.]
MLVSSGGGARVLQVAAYPILLFIYTPAQFGLYAGYTMIVTVATSIATMRYEWAIPVARSPRHAAGILTLAVLAAGVLAAIMLLAFGIFPRTLIGWTGLTGLVPVAWLAAFSMFGAASYGALTYWAVRFGAFSAIARTQVLKVVGELGAQLGLGLAGFGLWGLAIGHVVGMCLGLGSLLRVGDLRRLAPQRLVRLYVLARSWRDFPLYSGTAGLLSQASSRITLVALGAMFSPAALGLLWAAFAVLDAPTSVISTSAARIFYQTASEIGRSDPGRLRGLYVRTVAGAFAVSLAGGALAFFAIPWLMHVALPARWAGASDLVRALIPAYVGQLTVIPFICYGIVRRQRWQLAWDFLYLAANLGVLAFARFAGSDLVTLVLVLSLTRLAAYLLIIPVHLHILKPAPA